MWQKGKTMTRLIDANKLKMYIDTCRFCEKCPNIAFMCQRSCELPDCLTSQWERVIDEQPTVDAIPIEWIRAWHNKPISEESKKVAEQCEYDIIEWLIAEWAERKEE